MDDNAGAKLHPSGENFHHALLDAATGIAITGIDGRFLEANTAYCRMLGYTEDELRSLDFLTLTHPDDQASNRALITELVQGLRLNFVLEKRYLTKGGQVVWCRVSVAAQRDAEGRAQKIIGIAEDITQQRAAEAERNAVLAKSAALVTALGQVVYDRHPLNDSVDWSGRLTEVLGCSPKQMGTVADWAARVHPDDLAEAVAAIEAAVRQRHNYDLEYRFRHQDGHYLWMNDRGVVITQADGSSRIVGVLVDITGRKREAEALVTAHEQLAQRSQLMNMALRVARMGGWWVELFPEPVLHWSAEVAKIFGVDNADPIGLEEAFAAYAPEHEAAIRSAFWACAREGQSYELETQIIVHGRRIWGRAIGEPVRDVHGNIFRVQGAFQDISAQKEAEAEQRRFRQLADAMPFIVWTAAPDGAVDYSNLQFFEYTGLSTSTPAASRWQPCVHPDDLAQVLPIWGACVQEQKPYQVEFRLKNAQNEYRWFQVGAQPFWDDAGRLVKWYGIGIDIHETKRLEQAATHLAHRLTTTLESLTDAFFTLDYEGHFTYVNAQAERLLQKPREVLLGHGIWDLFPANFERHYRRAAAERVTVSFDEHHSALNLRLEARIYPSEEGLAVYLRDVTQRHQDEAQIRLLETCISRLNDIVLITEAEPVSEPGPRIQYVNDAFVRRTGYTREEVIGRSPRILRGPQTQRAALDRIRAALTRWQPVREEIINYTKSGEPFWLELDIVPVADAAGKYTHWVAIERDITERRQSDLKLRESEERFRLLAKATNDAIWDWDLLTQNLWWNEGFEALFGYDRKEIEPTVDSWLNRVHPEDLLSTKTLLQAAIEQGEQSWAGEYRFRRQDGSYAFVLDRGYIIRDPQGKATRMIGGITDLTARRATEDQLRDQATLLDHAQDAIFVQDLNDQVTYWNQGAERLFGWSKEEVLGESVDRRLRLEPSSAARLPDLLTQGVWAGELEVTSRLGERRTVASRWSVLRAQDGAPRGVLVINTDITQHKAIEAQLLRAQRLESIGTLAGGIAHDLNNVLTPIMTSIAMLQEEETNPEKIEYLTTLESCARRGADMVRHLLTFARGHQETARAPIDLAEVANEALKIIRETFPKQLRVNLSIAAHLWPVLADPTQMHQLLMNLCLNARDAMPNGGVLTLAVEAQILDEVYAGMNLEAHPGPYVVIRVEDTGAGMPKAVQDRIFEPFFTTKEVGKGTGLGLSTAHAIVKGHGGFIHVYSEVGKGTRFKIYLPAVVPPHAPQNADPDPNPLPRGKGELILVVDDEEGIRKITTKILERHGYRVLTAKNGAEAVSAYAQNRGTVAAVLTDMSMPVMDGPATIIALKAMDPEVKVIGCSGLDANGKVAQALDAGVRHFIPKPYSAETLLQILRKVLG